MWTDQTILPRCNEDKTKIIRKKSTTSEKKNPNPHQSVGRDNIFPGNIHSTQNTRSVCVYYSPSRNSHRNAMWFLCEILPMAHKRWLASTMNAATLHSFNYFEKHAWIALCMWQECFSSLFCVLNSYILCVFFCCIFFLPPVLHLLVYTLITNAFWVSALHVCLKHSHLLFAFEQFKTVCNVCMCVVEAFENVSFMLALTCTPCSKSYQATTFMKFRAIKFNSFTSTHTHTHTPIIITDDLS